MLRIHFTFHISHLALINHLSSNRFEKWQMLIAKSLRIDDCKLIIEPTIGGV